MCVILGLIIGILIVSSSSSYLSLLKSKDKVLYSLINGTASKSELFWSRFCDYLFPLVLLFLFGLNYYLSFASFIYVAYQSAIFVMSMAALVSMYKFSGIVSLIFIIIPINIIFFLLMAYFVVTITNRAYYAKRCGRFGSGFDLEFASKMIFSFLVVTLLSFISSFVLSIVIKSVIFVVFW